MVNGTKVMLTACMAGTLGRVIRVWRLLDEPVTAREVQETIGPHIERLDGKRLSELRDCGLVEECDSRMCRLGKQMVKTWKPSSDAVAVYDSMFGL